MLMTSGQRLFAWKRVMQFKVASVAVSLALCFAVLLGGSSIADEPAGPLPRYVPTSKELLDAEQRRDGAAPPGRVYKERIEPHWLPDNSRFWYRNELRGNGNGSTKEFILVDAENATRLAAFDHEKLAASLSKATKKEIRADRLPFDEVAFV